ncbi:YHS domain-containing protein [Dyadobacter sp. BE34]|uniref:YHS domain-containing protein n=1 Tax=Dyadobacter fermentans TaxID=94254 RepID=A0ABU1QV26_9BACT|nr:MULTISPECIES: YHS domain-containing (seleno)protein [Dyadobacter]MDR6805005.1 YHS domain-containing protein [Dyadobacter fermentans]MDR7043236.1 YHS domain-containing protein [Dyadobacter sp. BE242]MDR7197548.1 YHS domain-containing protein [Dyadobacter sp. BE34]MDR7215019.1 YHS domain-containing protein [Dyadobacter sp. BE31]MDR7262554.1 YHS domain-containing protein [Dyadobacter sp. BE32]
MKRHINLIFFFMLLGGIALAQHEEARKKQYNLESSGLAIQGRDPVAYFTLNKALEGKKDFSTSYNGVIYRFASKQNKDEFARNPTRYEPQYGGWCAYAMGKKGEKVEIDPETFKIVDGKLYLFYNKFFNNTLKSWNQDETRLKTQADRNWMKFVP